MAAAYRGALLSALGDRERAPARRAYRPRVTIYRPRASSEGGVRNGMTIAHDTATGAVWTTGVAVPAVRNRYARTYCERGRGHLAPVPGTRHGVGDNGADGQWHKSDG